MSDKPSPATVTTGGPITATEVVRNMEVFWAEREVLRLRMEEFFLTAGQRAMLHILNRELRWARVVRRWEAKHEPN